MVLAIDIGNTRIKGAVFEAHTMLRHFISGAETITEFIESVLDIFPDITNIVFSTVTKTTFEALQNRKNEFGITQITAQTRFPFTNLYATPNTIGIDRLVSAAGAVHFFPNKNRLIIDAGTCITFDVVNANDEYLGGVISPGIRMRYEALHHFTAKLPLLETEMPQHLIGNSTANSIHSGVVNGVVAEISNYVSQCQANDPNFIIILTGGDTEFLAKQLKNTIFANPNFLLESLNRTFQNILND